MESHSKRILAVIPIEFVWSENISKGVAAVLDNNTNRWDTKLRGIVKSYSKIRIANKKCKILEEVGVFLVQVKYTVEYFCPKLNEKIVGVARNWNSCEIGALVECFNTVITNEEGSYQDGIWKDKNSIQIMKGSKISFTLTK